MSNLISDLTEQKLELATDLNLRLRALVSDLLTFNEQIFRCMSTAKQAFYADRREMILQKMPVELILNPTPINPERRLE